MPAWATCQSASWDISARFEAGRNIQIYGLGMGKGGSVRGLVCLASCWTLLLMVAATSPIQRECPLGAGS